MTKTTEILIDGFTFTEGPRWHEGRLYFSDLFRNSFASYFWGPLGLWPRARRVGASS